MTDEEIVKYLKSGGQPNFGINGRNMEVVNFMASLEKQGLIATWDLGLSQETRREARWIGGDRIPEEFK